MASGKQFGPLLHHQGLASLALIDVVAFSPDGKTMVTGARDGKARLWDSTGKLLKPHFQHGGHTAQRLRPPAFSPDGKIVLTASSHRTARLWETATGNQIGPPLQHERWVWAVAFSPNGRTIITGSEDKTARLWETATGKQLGQTLQHQDEVRAVAFSPDGKTVVTGSFDHTARLWGCLPAGRSDHLCCMQTK